MSTAEIQAGIIHQNIILLAFNQKAQKDCSDFYFPTPRLAVKLINIVNFIFYGNYLEIEMPFFWQYLATFILFYFNFIFHFFFILFPPKFYFNYGVKSC